MGEALPELNPRLLARIRTATDRLCQFTALASVVAIASILIEALTR